MSEPITRIEVNTQLAGLSPLELDTERALLDAIVRIDWSPEPFDAVELIAEGRR